MKGLLYDIAALSANITNLIDDKREVREDDSLDDIDRKTEDAELAYLNARLALEQAKAEYDECLDRFIRLRKAALDKKREPQREPTPEIPIPPTPPQTDGTQDLCGLEK